MAATILAVLPRGRSARPALGAAALLAQAIPGSRIAALHVRHGPMEGFLPDSEVMTEERRQAVAQREDAREQAARRAFDAWQQEGGPEATWRVVTGTVAGVVAATAAGAACVVIARTTDGGDEDAAAALDAALFDARSPVLLVPAAVPATLGRCPAIAWRAGGAVERALAAARPVLDRAERLVVLRAEEGQSGPETPPAALLPAGIPVTVHRFAPGGRGIGDALMEEAVTQGADLLVMGAWTHSRLRERVLGGATREVLAVPALPVLMRH